MDRSVRVIEPVLLIVTIEYSHMVTANTKMFYEFAHNYTKFSGLFAGLVEQLWQKRNNRPKQNKHYTQYVL